VAKSKSRHLGGACSYKMKGRHLGLWMGLVKLVTHSYYKIKDQQKISTESTPKNISTEPTWTFELKK